MRSDPRRLRRARIQVPQALYLLGALLFTVACLRPTLALDEGTAPAVPSIERSAPPPSINPTANPRRPSINPQIDRDELLGHIQFLASEELKGREAGTPEQLKAAQYIADEFARYGLAPNGDEKDGRRSFFQAFSIDNAHGSKPETSLILIVDGKELILQAKKDFVPIPMGGKQARAEGGVVFAGYGIHDPEMKYDDFEGVNLDGKWALLSRYGPGENDPQSKFGGQRRSAHVTFVSKVGRCVEHKAAGVLIVAGAFGNEGEEPLGDFSGALLGEFAIPVFLISRGAADRILAPAGETIQHLQAQIEKGQAPHSIPINSARIAGTSALQIDSRPTGNVIAKLEGRDEKLKHECVLIGAHLDHVGYGQFGSLLGVAGRGRIHPGADDNASGTSGLLEIAQALAALPQEERPRRSIILAAFSGEEKGLLGSNHYVRHPAIPLQDTAAMLNLDMIGRSENGAIQVSGIGTAKGFKELVQKYAVDPGIKVYLGSSGDGPSDHATFHKQGLPVLFFCTGIHPDYHRPTDSWEKINAPVAEALCKVIQGILLDLANADTRPDPLPAVSLGYLGIGQDHLASAHEPGYPVGSVAPESPAGLAGLRPGDRILMFNGQRVTLAMDLSMAMLELGPGDVAILSIMRGAETFSVEITLKARPGDQRIVPASTPKNSGNPKIKSPGGKSLPGTK